MTDKPFWPRRCRIARGAVAVVCSLAAVAGVTLLSRTATHEALQSHLRAPIEFVEWTSTPPCGLMEHGFEYVIKQPEASMIGEYEGVDFDTLCRHKCFLVAECQVWTWNSDKSCKLIGVTQHSSPQKSPNPEATSGGMPCQMDQMLTAGTLYCWALIQPDGYEKDLLADQYNKHIGIFNCEENAILSNRQVEIVPGYVTDVVQTELGCAKGGEFGTALNLDIFITVWNHVVELGKFRAHDWTIKADPDAVFFADRLRGLLPHHPEEGRGVYLNNCKMGMHGPVEVFSRNAVDALTKNWQQCQVHFTQLCGGDCQWGEDMFIDQCLQKVVGARRDNEWSLLVEDHCLANPQEPWSFAKCDGTHVAFHPFKDKDTYSQCFGNAWILEAQAVKEQNQEVQPPR